MNFEEYINNSLARHIEKNRTLVNFEELTYHPQLTLEVLEKYPTKWNWNFLWKNPNFKWEWVEKFPDKPWNWSALSKHKDFSWEWVKANPDVSWDWTFLSTKMSEMQILIFSNKPLDWLHITMSSQISIEFMNQNIDLPWVARDLFFTNIWYPEIQFIRHYQHHYTEIDWNDHTKHTCWEIIKRNMDLPWNKSFIRIDKYEDGDIEYIKSFPGNWDMRFLSIDIPISVILENPEMNWDYTFGVSVNKTLKHKHVSEYPFIPWNVNLVPVDPEIIKWDAAIIIKRNWKHVITNPEYKICQKLFLKKMSEIDSDFKNLS